MTEQKQIQTATGAYEMHVALFYFNDDIESGEQKIGPVDYMWGRDGSETLNPSEAVKITTIDGEEIALTSDHWLRVEYSQNSLWQN